MNLWDFALALVKLWKGKLHHKIAFVVIGATGLVGSWATVLAAAFLRDYLSVTIADTPMWASLAVLALGLAVASPEIYRELKHPPHPHDIQLLAQFRALIDARTRRFLRDRPFYEPIHRYPVERLEQLNYEWQGALFEFRDPEVQSKFAEMHQQLEDFLNLFALSIWVLDANPDFYTAKNYEDEQQGDLTPGTRQKILDMIARAAATDESLDAFERIAIDRLG